MLACRDFCFYHGIYISVELCATKISYLRFQSKQWSFIFIYHSIPGKLTWITFSHSLLFPNCWLVKVYSRCFNMEYFLPCLRRQRLYLTSTIESLVYISYLSLTLECKTKFPELWYYKQYRKVPLCKRKYLWDYDYKIERRVIVKVKGEG